MKRRGHKILSMALAAAMLFSMTGMNTVFALEGGQTIGASGLCEHHPAHTADCGYTEGTSEIPCDHEHTDECCKEVTKCVHEHMDDCCGDEIPTATDSGAAEQVNCAHSCDAESGCVSTELDCSHEHQDCGYASTVPGTPCAFVCGECAKGSGEQNPPPANDGPAQIRAASAADTATTYPITTADELKTALVAATPATISVTADIALTSAVTVGADHTLHLAENATVSTGNYQLTIPDGKTLTLTGTGTLETNTASNSQNAIYVLGTLSYPMAAGLPPPTAGTPPSAFGWTKAVPPASWRATAALSPSPTAERTA